MGRHDINGTIIGDGEFHCNYEIFDFEGFPITSQVQEAYTTESVYVSYRRTDILSDSVQVRYSDHICNGIKFGVYVDGRHPEAKKEVLSRLGLLRKVAVPVMSKYVAHRNVTKKTLKQYQTTPVTIAKLEELPEGTDISEYTGKVCEGTNILIVGNTVAVRQIGTRTVYQDI